MKTMIFIPCSGAKRCKDGEEVTGPSWVAPQRLPQSWADLNRGRAKRRVRLGAGFRAVSVYDGWLYRSAPALKETTAAVTIISAGYGLTGRDDPIQCYNCEMKGKVAAEWRGYGLHHAITELIVTERPTHVVGVFFGQSEWSNDKNKPMYRWFYEEGVRLALVAAKIDFAGTVYRRRGAGQQPILSSLGFVLDRYLRSGLSADYLEELRRKPFARGQVEIAFEKTKVASDC